MNCQHMHCCTHVMNCQTGSLKDFNSRTEAMELKCLSGNAWGLNKHAQVYVVTLAHSSAGTAACRL